MDRQAKALAAVAHRLAEVLPQVVPHRPVAVHPQAEAREARVAAAVAAVVPKVPAAAADNPIGRSVAVAINIPQKC